MSQERQPPKRKRTLVVVILWAGISISILLGLLYLFTHRELFIAEAFALSVAMFIWGAVTKQLYR